MARLRVGVAPHLRELAEGSGHANAWRRTLEHLAARDDIRLVFDNKRRRLGRTPDVYLGDGHAGGWDTPAPLVVALHEAGWLDPELGSLLHPQFARDIADRTAVALAMADRVITPSEASRRQVIDGYDLAPDRVAAIHWGVDAQVFHPSAVGGRALVARALGEDRPYVLFVSVAHPRKNLGVLREAMSRLVGAGFPHALALVAGPALDRPDSSDLEAAARADLPSTRNRVASVPAPSDAQLAGLMAGADAFCLPSLWEGFGLTALEAMACGAPVVVSDRGALPEVVADAGVVVAPHVDALTAALQDLLGDPARRTALGRAARSRAETFTWARTAEQWRDVLLAAAAQKGGSTLNANPIGRQC